MNQIIVDGFVNNLRHGTTKNDTAWCSFSVGNSTYAGKDDNGNSKYNKHWFDVSTFDGLAESCIRNFSDDETPYLVQVMGQMEQREYETDAGEKRKAYSIKAREISRGGNISSFSTEANSAPAAASAPTF